MRKRIWIMALLAIICFCAVLMLWRYRPQRLVQDAENAEVRYIQVRSGDELIDLADFPEEEILDYLQTCKMRRTGENKDNYLQDDVTLWIFLADGDERREIVLGADSFCWNDSTGHRKYTVLHASDVTAHLMELLGSPYQGADSIRAPEKIEFA